MAELTVTLETFNDEDEEISIELPAKYVACDECEGHGSVLNASMRNHCYSLEEFNEAFFDADDRAAYFTRGGKYDVTCPTCKGLRVVPRVDTDKLNAEQRALFQDYLRRLRRREREDYEDRITMMRESGQWG